jgi:hypothetical protein
MCTSEFCASASEEAIRDVIVIVEGLHWMNHIVQNISNEMMNRTSLRAYSSTQII